MYKPTQNGQMKLQLSNDKKYILLPIFEKSKVEDSENEQSHHDHDDEMNEQDEMLFKD